MYFGGAEAGVARERLAEKAEVGVQHQQVSGLEDAQSCGLWEWPVWLPPEVMLCPQDHESAAWGAPCFQL